MTPLRGVFLIPMTPLRGVFLTPLRGVFLIPMTPLARGLSYQKDTAFSFFHLGSAGTIPT